MNPHSNHHIAKTTKKAFRTVIRHPRATAAVIAIGMISYNVFLQIGLCRFSDSFVELKNRIILGSLLMPMLGFGVFHFSRYIGRADCDRIAARRLFTVLLSSSLAVLSPLMTLCYASVHWVHAAVVTSSILFAAIRLRGGRRFTSPFRIRFMASGRSLRRHALLVLIVPTFFFVFLCEINDQWDVYEADGPYYGQFARNILRYDLSYTRLLRTHGTGDHAKAKNKRTHNLRHPNGYIVYLTAWYLIVGSELSRPAQRMLPLLSNFLFLLMLYLFILKKTESTSVAAGASLVYILIPIASTFAGKIHQLSMMHTLLMLGIVAYDKTLNGSKTALRYMLAICVLTLFTDWYAAFFWPLVWMDYLVRYLRNRSRFALEPLYLLPAACVVACVVIFGHMLLGKISFGSFEYVANLRFKANYVKQFTMESFNQTLVIYLVRDYTSIVYQVGALWPLLFAVRVVRRRADRLDVYTLICLVYALVNVYLFKKIFIHYFEVIHFLPYAILAGCAMLRYIHPWMARLGRGGGVFMVAAVALSMLPDTVDGIRYYRLRHGGSYTDGYAEAAEFVRANISRHETVITNRIFNIYSNERHIFGNRLVKCDTVTCFKKIRKNEDPAFVILFRKDSDARFFKYVLRQGTVHLFHERVVVVDLKDEPNLLSRLPTGEDTLSYESDLLTEDIRLMDTILPKNVPLQRPSFLKTHLTSLNKDKFLELAGPVLSIEYAYHKVQASKSKSSSKSKANKGRNDSLYTEIRDTEGRVVKSARHALTESFYPPKHWPRRQAVHETVTIPLAPELPPDVYHVFACSSSTEIAVGHFYLGRSPDDLQEFVAARAPAVPLDRPLSPALSLVGTAFSSRSLSPGDTVRIDTFYRKQRETRDAISPVIRIRDVRAGDVKVPVHPDPVPLLKSGTVYRYPTHIDIPAYALGGVKHVFLEAGKKSIELGTIEITSPRRNRDILVEGAFSEHRFPVTSKKAERTLGIVQKKKTLKIRFSTKKRSPVHLLLEAGYTDTPAGYTVVVDLSRSKFNGGRHQRIESDIVEKTVSSKERYLRKIKIPAQLVRKGKNHITIEPLRPGRIDKTYPGWRNVLFKLCSPTVDWLLRRDLSSELPRFEYIAVDTE